MRLAEIDANGIVVNVIEADPGAVPDFAAGFIDMGNQGGVGWTWDGQFFTEPPAPGPDRSVMQLTRRQVMTGLLLEGMITAAEATAPANMPPLAIEAIFVAMPQPQQSIARITWANFTVAYRLDPFVAMLAAVAPVPLDDAALDTFFIGYASV